jgi:UDP-N-acetylmuramate dehydrogenase
MMAAQLSTGLRGTLLEGEPMARHTTWRVGGPAERYYQPADLADLAGFLASQPADEPLTWVGLGSNLLVRDGGIRGTVIATSGLLNEIEQLGPTTVRAEAGVSCAKVARFCARLGLVGAEFLAGIPGTLGGALAMNAGAFGGETWALVESVESLDRQGKLHRRSLADYRIGYRSVQGPAGEWFVAATLSLSRGDAEAAVGRIRELLEQRGASQPTQQPNAGSVFRNPPGDHAARLIEAAGLKGQCLGGACVSDKHANFIVNTGRATAAEIEALIEQVAQTVRERFGVALEREVHILGEAAHD